MCVKCVFAENIMGLLVWIRYCKPGILSVILSEINVNIWKQEESLKKTKRQTYTGIGMVIRHAFGQIWNEKTSQFGH